MKKGNKIVLAVLSAVLVCALIVSGIFLWKNRQYSQPVVGDVSWYTEDEKEFTITTVEEFYGMAELSKTYDFKGQTVKLGDDIVVNQGDAEDWAKKAPARRWIPITGFAGKFDGQGHTISGIYGDSVVTSLGLFTDTKDSSVIKDFRLENSYFKNNNDKGTGSIVGFGGGKIESIYSAAILQSSGQYVGGLMGRMNVKGENQITNCWFDGTITMNGIKASNVGGLVGAITEGNSINAIQHCLSTAHISCIGSNVGGICGNLGNGTLLNLIDTLNVGTLEYDVAKYDVVGSVFGQITGNSNAIVKDSYTIYEIANRTIGTNGGYLNGSPIPIKEKIMVGNGGYEWTTMDFDTYWSVQKDDTPVLTYFAESSESVAGLERLVDISWYNPTGKTFEIKSTAQFWGFAYLSRSNSFSGQTIKLGTDVVINEGNAKDWQKEAPKYEFTPIAWHGNSLSQRFRGTFDGQGHTISGVYIKGDEDDGYLGLFGEIYAGATVKNFKLVNSYIEGTMPSSKRGTVGSVCGRLRGTVDGVYSDAIIVNSARMTGGMVGMIHGTGENTIKNCWFDGELRGITRMGGMLGGVYGNKGSIEARIENCLNSGDIAVTLGYGDVGGMCGIAETWCTLYIDGCLNTGTFKTIDVGNGKTENKHIGTIFGSVTQTDGVGSKVIITNSYGTKDFYSRIVGWKYEDTGAEVKSATFVTEDEIKGVGGYQWTTLDFKNSWAVRKTDVPVPVPFATSRPSVSGIARMIDFDWYTPGKDVYTVKNYQQLFTAARMWDIVNQFKGKTLKLGADITFNQGNASEWGEKAPTIVWTPMRFNGTFDGQGHTISGVYVKGDEDDNYLGFFYRIYEDGTAKNFKLTNSYIEGTMKNNQRGAVGSIAGRSNGVIDTVYSDAIIVNSARMTGGIVGMITGEGKNGISNAWFDGQLTGITRMGGILGGVYAHNEDMTVDIAHCLNTGDISNTAGYQDVGGILGMVEGSKDDDDKQTAKATVNITDSLNAGTYAETGDDASKTHIGTIVGSITEDYKVVMSHTYGTKEFYNRLIGWKFADKAASQSSVAFVAAEEIKGVGGYKWTTLDFAKYWAIRETDSPVLAAFASSRPSVAGVTRMVDYSWYDASKDVYVLKTAAQLYGFARMAKEDAGTFEGKTIKLGADITVNSGDANTWSATNAPENVWTSINLAGTFDGQGHTISGIYVYNNTDTVYTGLFGTIQKGATVKNLNLVNSYIEGASTYKANDRCGTGSIAGRSLGTIDTVYSNAIVKNSRRMTGGIVGMMSDAGENLITNTWFDGSVSGITRTGGILGGVYGNKKAIEATISHCLNTGDVSVKIGQGDVGGMCGMVETQATLNITDCLNAGAFATIGEGTANTHIGTLMGSVADDAKNIVNITDSYGVSEFYAKVTGWKGANATVKVTSSAMRAAEKLNGYNAYQWTSLDFEDTDGDGKDKAYWVLKDGKTPALAVFDTTDLDLEVAKGLTNYNWYDESKTTFTLNTKEELLSFNELCNAEETNFFKGKTIKLGADIDLNESWTASATLPDGGVQWTAKEFNGTFDGDGHTIKGLYIKENGHAGLFKVLNAGSKVTDVRIETSYIQGTSTGTRQAVGSVAGQCHGTISKVYSEAILKNSSAMTGGIAGMVSTDKTATIENCWFNGEISVTNQACGGILGGTYSGTANIKHCLNTGTLSTTKTSQAQVGGLMGFAHTGSTVTIEDSLNAGVYGSPSITSQVASIIGGIHNSAKKVETNNVYGIKEFYNKVSGYNTPTVAEGKECVVDAKANFYGKGAAGLAYNTWWIADEKTTPMLKYFSSSDAYSWYDPSESVYTISTPQALLEFNELCNADDTNYFKNKTINLGADINLNESWPASATAPTNTWTTNNFNGKFDGQGHTISGLYIKENGHAGLFKVMNAGSEVTNLKIVNSYIQGTSTGTRQAVGSVAGQCHGTISKVYSEAILKNSSAMTGGIAGMVSTDKTGTIENCWFNGEISVTNQACGGILGGTYSGTANIKHCLNTGTLSTTKTSQAQVGGLMGFAHTGSTVTIEDSLNAGVYGSPSITSQVATIIGGIHNSAKKVEVSNVYGIKEFYNKVSGYNTPTVVSGKECVVEEKGTFYAQGASGLDFAEYWVARTDKTPILKSFQ